ncbi:MAG: NnrS family protein [Gallionellaceae bacterium]|nr:NnrS family protein [Gallionellaceae bacterium]
MSIANRWQVFTAAPHRVMFFGGALQAVAVMLWWLVELATRYGIVGEPVDWPLAPVAIHSYLMIFGVFPMFMFGFLMTTFPRWMSGFEIPARRYVPAFVLLMLGTLLFYAGLAGGRGMLVAAAISMLAGWGTALYALLRVLLDTRHQDKRHPQIVFVALLMGWCSLGSYLAWLLSDVAIWLRIAQQGGIWLFLLPLFASVAHRMLPFFTGSALQLQNVPRPSWPWWVMLAGSAAHGLLQLANADALLWLADVPLAMGALYLSHAWGFQRSLRIPLLAVLHIGFAWLGIAMLLSGVQSFVLFDSHGATRILGLAPLHALTIGCFSTLLIGMATRVTLGHSGLPMRIDARVTAMFVAIQLVAVLRVLADMLPALSLWMYVAAAALWLLCFAAWTMRYLPVYLRPRADGLEG